MKSIDTLIPDVYKLLEDKDAYSRLTDNIRRRYESDLCSTLENSLQGGPGDHTPRLRLSGLGTDCPRALWYSIHQSGDREPIPAWARFKYTYGHLIEHLCLTLARLAGHSVEGEQDEVVLHGVVGHRDAVIDGCVVDVKSAASRSFLKFKNKTLEQDDPFGYLLQLGSYVLASAEDPLVTTKTHGYFWAVDKSLGHMVLYKHEPEPGRIEQRIRQCQSICGASKPPPCECKLIGSGKSGNVALGVTASYSPFKHCCFPNLRTFLYVDGPVYLTEVKRKPDVPEINKDGRIVYSS